MKIFKFSFLGIASVLLAMSADARKRVSSSYNPRSTIPSSGQCPPCKCSPQSTNNPLSIIPRAQQLRILYKWLQRNDPSISQQQQQQQQQKGDGDDRRDSPSRPPIKKNNGSNYYADDYHGNKYNDTVTWHTLPGSHNDKKKGNRQESDTRWRPQNRPSKDRFDDDDY